MREELVEVLLAAEGDSDVAQRAEGDLPCLLEALIGGERHASLLRHLRLREFALLTPRPHARGHFVREIVGCFLLE